MAKDPGEFEDIFSTSTAGVGNREADLLEILKMIVESIRHSREMTLLKSI